MPKCTVTYTPTCSMLGFYIHTVQLHVKNNHRKRKGVNYGSGNTTNTHWMVK